MLRAWSKIIVEEQDDHWTAWLEDLPQVAVGGEWPSDAIRQLIEHVGKENFYVEGIIAVDDGTRDRHLEFLMPLLGFRRLPIPSVN